jgi:hypothetical protein
MRSLATVLALALVIACRSKTDGPPAPAASPGEPAPAVKPPAEPTAPAAATTPPPTDPSTGSCEVTVDGDVKASGHSGGGPEAVGTDYWLAPADIEEAIRRRKATDAEREQALAEAKARDPYMIVLLVNCTSEHVRLTLSPGVKAKYADVPFAPARYPITRKTDPASNFSAMLLVDGQAYELPSDADGTVELTKFDRTGIAGRFELPAQRTDYKTKVVSKITVKGQFDFKCSYPSSVCRGS